MLTREGDLGREFFVIVDGEVSVTKDGEEIRRLGPGDFFGEIALIYDTAAPHRDGDRRLAAPLLRPHAPGVPQPPRAPPGHRGEGAWPRSSSACGRPKTASRRASARRSDAPRALAAPAAEPPVHLGAEHEDVRHHVEPDEQQHEAAEGLQRDEVAARQAHEGGQALEARLQEHRGEERAREGLPPRERSRS